MSISSALKRTPKAVTLSQYQLISSRPAKHFHVAAPLVSRIALWQRIIGHIERCEFDLAHRLQARYPLLIPLKQYRQQLHLIVQELLYHNLSVYNFQQADKICLAGNYPTFSYESIKANAVQRFSLERFGLDLIPEQSAAIAKIANHLLIKARAGSGKTAVMACKAATLLSHCPHDPNSVLILAFNRRAASEIKKRIQNVLGVNPNARTFHSLASSIAHPQKLLFDDPDGNPEQTNFIKELLVQKGDDKFNRQIYQFLRSEYGTAQADNTSSEPGKSSQVTINGIRVKSNGEKYIGDFLVEHDITWYYERPKSGPTGTIYPDFTLWIPELNREFIWEHWGTGKADPRPITPPGWDITEVEYVTRKQAKINWYVARGSGLIETSIDDLVNGREAFEQILCERLAQVGIQVAKLSPGELQVKLADKINKKLFRLCQQFIARAKRALLSPEDLRTLIAKRSEMDQRMITFWHVAIRLYELYQEELLEQGYIDFDDLLMEATERIRSLGGMCSLALTDQSSIFVRDIRYILIDEYQDFSPLFYKLIESICLQNPDIQILAVGDDWQAINGFAGSQLQYFHNFTNLFHCGEYATLLTNHRSHAKIVEESNKVMVGQGKPSIYRVDHAGGTVGLQYIDDIWLPQKRAQILGGTADGEAYYYFEKFDAAFLAAKCARVCYKILTAPQNSGKRVAILSRTRYIHGQSLEDYKNKFAEILTAKQQALVDFSTIHAYKGLEADIIILLDVSRRNFPYLHPDNQLLSLVGVTLEETLAEEQRLFYVAMTRAKEQLYLLAERNTVSNFARDLPTAHLGDLAAAPKKPGLWVGQYKERPSQTFVYDPGWILADDNTVYLYSVEQATYAPYPIAQIKPKLQTVTDSSKVQRAIKEYKQWQTKRITLSLYCPLSTGLSTKHTDSLDCLCPVCSGTPNLDPTFITLGDLSATNEQPSKI